MLTFFFTLARIRLTADLHLSTKCHKRQKLKTRMTTKQQKSITIEIIIMLIVFLRDANQATLVVNYLSRCGATVPSTSVKEKKENSQTQDHQGQNRGHTSYTSCDENP